MSITKTIRFLLTASLITASMLLSSCDSKSDNDSQNKKSIVVATYPEYDWLRQIIGQDSPEITVTLLMNKGVDAHSYEPSIQDIAAISKADLFIYNGGDSYQWTERVLKLKSKPERQTLNLMESLGENIQHEEGETCTHHHDEHCTHEHHHHEEHEHHADEHIWLSLKNAIQLCEHLEETASELSPEHAEAFEANKQAYIAQLKALDARYAETISKASRDTIIVADRFPFTYLFADYGLKHHAAFHGCSAETEASFETISQLSHIVKSLQPKVIIIVKGGMRQLAQTLIQNSGQNNCQVKELDDLHSASERSYLDTMSDNLKVIKAALAP